MMLMALDAEEIRKDFPIFRRKINGKPLVYLDSAATAQKPRHVIDTLASFYENYNSNVHRGVHTLSVEATELYDKSREKTAAFISANPEEIVFAKNCTEAINIVLYSWAMQLKKGDEILTTVMEHHSNIVPWQSLKKRGVKLKFADIDEEGKLKMDEFSGLLTKRTKLVAVTHASNVLGTINPVKEIAKMAHDNGALCLVDGAQSVPHMPVDVKSMGCDFLAFSGHKMLAPTGIGCLYGRKEILENMPPFHLGSDMMKEVTLYKTAFREPPWRFEAGTPDFAGAVALGTAVDYLKNLGMKNVHRHEKELSDYALKRLSEIKDVTIYGPGKDRAGVISFNLGDVHSHDLASVLDEDGIAIRSGHHCAMPLMKRLNVTAVARASFYVYNNKKDIDILSVSVEKARKVFRL